jgi:hypothetical protein
VTVTRRGRLDPGAAFFTADGAAKVLYCSSPTVSEASERFGAVATVVDGGQPVDMHWMSRDLLSRGVGRLMVEGGGLLLDQSITAIENDPTLSDEQKESYIDAIRTSTEYTAITDNLAAVDAQLAEYGIARDELDETVEQLTAAIPELEQGLSTLDELIAEAESGKADLESGYDELERQKQQVYAQLDSAQSQLNQGKLALEAGEQELEAGKLQLEQAEKTAEEQLQAAKDAANLHSILTKDMVARLL